MDRLSHDLLLVAIDPQKPQNQAFVKASQIRFIYEPLTGPADIRLLVLTSGQSDDMIKCFLLKPMSLDSLDTPQEFEGSNVLLRHYLALSYVWGDPHYGHLISVNGNPFWVTSNLHSALQRVRAFGHEYQLLWVDAICIDQNNPSERKAQVQIMSRIYRQAEAMIADTGEEFEGADLLAPLLEKIVQAGKSCDVAAKSLEMSPSNALVKQQSLGQIISTVVQSPLARHYSIKDKADEAIGSAKSVILRLEHYGMPPKTDPAWISFRRFLASPYFCRLWVLQEFALAPRILVLCGNKQLSASDLVHSIQYLSSYGTGTPISYFAVYGSDKELQQDIQTRTNRTKGLAGLMTLINEKLAVLATLPEEDHRTLLIHKMGEAKLLFASDERDKIYALMGLSSDAKVYSSSIDYSQSYEVVYRRFAKLFIDNGHGIELLYQACTTNDWTRLPTWVPDWQNPDRILSRVVEPGLSSNFAASSSPDACFQVDEANDSITVAGVIIDTVTKLSDTLKHVGKSHENQDQDQLLVDHGVLLFNDILGFFVSGMHFATEISEYPTNENSLEVFLRTFIRGPPCDITHSQMLCLRKGVRAIFDRVKLGMSVKNENTRLEREKWMTEAQRTEDDMTELFNAGVPQARKRCFCITARGYFGLVPGKVHIGDKVAVFNGGQVPFILREVEPRLAAEPAFQLVGDGYFHGLMHGEASTLDHYEEQGIMLV